MNFTEDFLNQAKACITKVFHAKRDELLKANGTTKEIFKQHAFSDEKEVVTAFDKTIDGELRAALNKFDAGIGYEGEELGATGSRETYWLADPIDGTESFVRGLPSFRNMVVLVDAGKPIFALVYRVVADELFEARAGKGAYKNGQRLTFSKRPLERTRLEVWTKFNMPEAGPLLAAIEPKIENIRFVDDFLLVVEGKLDAHLAYKSYAKPWDHAPRMLLLSEAGASVANIGSNTYDFTNPKWLAASPEVFDQLMPVIENNLGVK